MGRKPDKMRSSNKSRSRNKNQNRRSSANVINRVFDSSGPDGKVRGTPQQIIEKYQMLARDSQLSGDRVAAENFLQHSEHYARLLSEAHREQAQRREQHEAQQAQRKEAQANAATADAQNAEQPDIGDAQLGVKADTDTGLVETPEGKQKPAPDAQKSAPEAAEDTGQAAE